MRLDEYLKSKDQTQAAFGATLTPPVGQSMVSQWIRGETRVTLPYAIQIRDTTGNAVSVDDCLAMYGEASGVEKAAA